MPMTKGVEVASAKNVEITFDILNTERIQSELKTLKDVLKSSYGPTGRLNLIQNVNGGHVTVSSNSQRILNSITSISTPITQLLLQAIKGHLSNFKDGGLFTGLLILELIDMSLQSTLPRNTVIKTNEHAMNTILSHMQISDCACKIKADIGNMQQMLCVMKSVLGTKCATGIKPNELQTLSVLLLRGFLGCIPNLGMSNKTISLENLRIHGCEGPSINESSLMEGVLLETRCFPENDTVCQNHGMVIKVALYDSSLAGNVDDKWFDGAQTMLLNNVPNIEDSVLVSMKRMVDKLAENGVRLIACQKVIHPTLQRYVTKKGLYCIERLSITHTETVQKLTGATRLSTFQGNDARCFGSLKNIEPIVLHKKRFLHLIPHQTTHPISTVILCAPDETSLDELQLVCSSVLMTLKQLVYHPYLVPGGGCFETHLAGLLIQTSQDDKLFCELGCSKGQYYEGLHSVASVFLQLARSIDHDIFDHFVDTETYHHWINQPQHNHGTKQLQNCLCCLVVSSQDTEWCMTEELLCKTDINCIGKQPTTSYKFETEYKSATLDVLSMKLNGIKTAFETANMILRVKHFVKEIV